jgi:hypothetical protein
MAIFLLGAVQIYVPKLGRLGGGTPRCVRRGVWSMLRANRSKCVLLLFVLFVGAMG